MKPLKRQFRKAGFLAFALGAVTSLLSGCASGSSTGSGTTQGLEVVSVDPADKATNVPLSSCPTGVNNGPCGGVFTVTFNEVVDMNTLAFQITPPISLNVRCPSAGPGETGCPGSNPLNSSAVVTFIGANGATFASDTSYTVTVVNGATPSPNVVHLSKTYEWTFTTAGS